VNGTTCWFIAFSNQDEAISFWVMGGSLPEGGDLPIGEGLFLSG